MAIISSVSDLVPGLRFISKGAGFITYTISSISTGSDPKIILEKDVIKTMRIIRAADFLKMLANGSVSVYKPESEGVCDGPKEAGEESGKENNPVECGN